MGRFRAPTLRNIAVTAPYMHDGGVATLDAAVTHYASGGKAESLSQRPGARISAVAGEKADVVAFLESLTDRRF